MSERPSRTRAAIFAIAFFLAALLSRPLFTRLPDPFATVAWKSAWVILCVSAVGLAHRVSLREAPRELGIASGAARGLLFAALAALPMLVVYLVFAPDGAPPTPMRLFIAAPFSAFTEEVLFRGYLFRQLHRRAGWGLATSMLVSALVFAAPHLFNFGAADGLSDVLVEIGWLSMGGAFFAWLFVRWSDNLWVPIGVHAFMNLWYEIFVGQRVAASDTATTVGRLLTVVSAVLITLRFTRRLTSAPVGPVGSGGSGGDLSAPTSSRR